MENCYNYSYITHIYMRYIFFMLNSKCHFIGRVELMNRIKLIFWAVCFVVIIYCGHSVSAADFDNPAGIINTHVLNTIFELEKEGYRVNAPLMKFCTDNAAMVASCAYFNTNWQDFDIIKINYF